MTLLNDAIDEIANVIADEISITATITYRINDLDYNYELKGNFSGFTETVDDSDYSIMQQKPTLSVPWSQYGENPHPPEKETKITINGTNYTVSSIIRDDVLHLDRMLLTKKAPAGG